MSAKPLYAFGYGLSYSSFDYSNLQVSLKENGNDFACTVSFDVANNGKLAGDEVAQLYIVDEVSSVVTPVMQLKRFERKNIAAGTTARYSFQLTKEDLKLWNASNAWKTEKGKFKFLVGASSDDIRLKGEMELTRDY
jgi:beta-glucosidase